MSSLIDGYLKEETKGANNKQPVKQSYLKAGLFDSSSSSDEDDFYERKKLQKVNQANDVDYLDLADSELKDFE